jgi:hypothetical protein
MASHHQLHLIGAKAASVTQDDQLTLSRKTDPFWTGRARNRLRRATERTFSSPG